MAWDPDYISLSDLKSFLRIDTLDTQDDAQLALAITAASRTVDAHCNRQFGNALMTRSYLRFYMHRFTPGASLWTSYIGYDMLYHWMTDDLSTVTTPTVVADGVTLTTNDYAFLPINASVDGEPYSVIVTQNQYNRLDVTGTFGWSAIPVPVKQATTLQASRIFSRRNSPYGVAGSPEQGGEIRLLAKVDPDVAVVLKGYSRLKQVLA